MGTTRKRAQGRSLRALTTTLVLALLAAMLLAGTGLAAGHEGLGKSARPGRPTAKAPTGTIATTTPTFTWSKVRGAAKYELRVYEGSTLLLKKTGISKRSWKSSEALPQNVSLTWKVRARSASGPGAWSKSLTFKVVPSSPAKAITTFSFQGLTPPVSGTINETLHTIALSVPSGTNVTALAPTITITGASVSPASGVANNFTSPRTYTVTAADASTQTYLVTVTVAPNPATKYVVTSSSYSPVAGATVTISAQLADANGNAVGTAGKVVTWSKTGTGGSFATPTSTTNASGIATVVFTTNTALGTVHTVTGADTDSHAGTSPSITTTAGTRTLSVSAWVSDPAPAQYASVTAYCKAVDQHGAPISGVAMTFTWHYKTTTPVESGTSGSDGVATCTRSIGRATVGYTVYINISATWNGQYASTSTSFTPR